MFVCLFMDGPVSRPTTHSRNCWLQITSAEFASWVLAQLGIYSPASFDESFIAKKYF